MTSIGGNFQGSLSLFLHMKQNQPFACMNDPIFVLEITKVNQSLKIFSVIKKNQSL